MSAASGRVTQAAASGTGDISTMYNTRGMWSAPADPLPVQVMSRLLSCICLASVLLAVLLTLVVLVDTPGHALTGHELHYSHYRPSMHMGIYALFDDQCLVCIY